MERTRQQKKILERFEQYHVVTGWRLGHVVSLNFTGPRLRNEDFAHLKNLSRLETLCLMDCPNVTDAGLLHISKLTTLKTLVLYDTKVTDVGLERLRTLKNLRHLDLIETETTAEGVEELQKKLPNCIITTATAKEVWY